MKGAIVVLWFDNSYRRRFYPTPHDTSPDCTAIVVAPVSKAMEFLWSFPCLPTPQASAAQVGKLLTTTQLVFVSALSDLMEDEIPTFVVR